MVQNYQHQNKMHFIKFSKFSFTKLPNKCIFLVLSHAGELYDKHKPAVHLLRTTIPNALFQHIIRVGKDKINSSKFNMPFNY